MKKMIKIVTGVVLLFAILLGVALVYLDSGIKKAVETFGPQYTKTEVQLQRATIAPWSGRGSLRGLAVGNPDGFSGAKAFSVDEISVAIDVDTLNSNPLVIESIRIVAPQVTYEQAGKHTNLQQLQRNIERSLTGSSVSSRADVDDSADEQKLVIKELLISGGRIHYRNALLGDNTVDVALPQIRLSGIGEKTGGVTGAELAQQLLKAINRSTISAIQDADAVQALSGQMEERLNAEKTRFEESLDGFKGLLSR